MDWMIEENQNWFSLSTVEPIVRVWGGDPMWEERNWSAAKVGVYVDDVSQKLKNAPNAPVHPSL